MIETRKVYMEDGWKIDCILDAKDGDQWYKVQVVASFCWCL